MAEADGAGQSAYTNGVQLRRSTISLPAGKTARFGVSFTASAGGAGAAFNGPGRFQLNSIVSSTQGFVTGIDLNCKEGSTYGHLAFVGNSISGCSGDGFILRSDGGLLGVPNIDAHDFAYNTIRGNGGSGVVLWWDEMLHDDDDGSGHINFIGEGNLFADNGKYGIEVRNLGANSTGLVKLVNGTIAYNELAGEAFLCDPSPTVEKFGEIVRQHQNMIMYFNNDLDQVVISPPSQALLDTLFSQVSYSDWQGRPALFCGPGNLDPPADPMFVDAANGNYHLDGATPGLSPCIDVGVENDLTLATHDIDGQPRVQDGDHSNCGQPAVPVIDMGVDEVPDPCDG